MVIVDSNVLLYAANPQAQQHLASRRWIEQTLNGSEAVGLPWVTLLGFIRVATRQGAFPSPLTVTEAFTTVNRVLAAAPSTVVQPTSRHASLLQGLLNEAGTAGNLVPDAHLAALAIEHGARICSFDRDFARFPGVQVFAPA